MPLTVGRWFLAAALLLWIGTGDAVAADDPGAAILEAHCSACHDLTGPAPATLKTLWARQGPDLFYAGDKYRPEWIAVWLQHPTRIRPAGMFYADHIKATDQWDVVDKGTLKPHLTLNATDAKAVAATLSLKHAHRALVSQVHIQAVSLSPMMGDLLFDKFRGCIACHQSAPDYGGFSAPELYTAARRLTPEYAYSYMENPQAWDPRIWMPNVHLPERDLNKLVRYLEMISKEVK